MTLVARDITIRNFDLNRVGESAIIPMGNTDQPIDIQFVRTLGSWGTAVVRVAQSTSSTRPDDGAGRFTDITGITDDQHYLAAEPAGSKRFLILYVTTPEGSAARCDIFVTIKEEV